MAYGTESIRAVDVIVGPGNRYVAMAERLVAGEGAVGVPSAFTGPSEVVVVADGTTPVDFAAIDLVVQAEHGPTGSAYLITWSTEAADADHAPPSTRLTEASPRRADIDVHPRQRRLLRPRRRARAGHGRRQRDRARAPRADVRRPRVAGARSCAPPARSSSDRGPRPASATTSPAPTTSCRPPARPASAAPCGSTTSASTSTSSSVDRGRPGRRWPPTWWPSPTSEGLAAHADSVRIRTGRAEPGDRPMTGCPSRGRTSACGRATTPRRSTSRCASTPTSRRCRHRPAGWPALADELAGIELQPLSRPAGDRAARAALAELHGVRAEQVFCANGSNEVLQSLCLAYGGPGRSVAVFEPTYALHSHIAQLTGTAVVEGQRRPDFSLDLDVVRDVLVRRARPSRSSARPTTRPGWPRPGHGASACSRRRRDWSWSTRPTVSSPTGRRSTWSTTPSPWSSSGPSPRPGRWRRPAWATWSGRPRSWRPWSGSPCRTTWTPSSRRRAGWLLRFAVRWSSGSG